MDYKESTIAEAQDIIGQAIDHLDVAVMSAYCHIGELMQDVYDHHVAIDEMRDEIETFEILKDMVTGERKASKYLVMSAIEILRGIRGDWLDNARKDPDMAAKRGWIQRDDATVRVLQLLGDMADEEGR